MCLGRGFFFSLQSLSHVWPFATPWIPIPCNSLGQNTGVGRGLGRFIFTWGSQKVPEVGLYPRFRWVNFPIYINSTLSVIPARGSGSGRVVRLTEFYRESKLWRLITSALAWDLRGTFTANLIRIRTFMGLPYLFITMEVPWSCQPGLRGKTRGQPGNLNQKRIFAWRHKGLWDLSSVVIT